VSVEAPAPAEITSSLPQHRPYRFLALLITELTLILGFPFTAGSDIRFHLYRVLAILVFAAALYAVLGRGRITAVAFLLGMPAIVVHFENALGFLERLQIVALILGIVFLVFVTGVFIWTVLSDPSVTADTLAGAVSAYLLVGITYGLAYWMIEQLAPGSFRQTVEPGTSIKPTDYVFFSFVTLTTLGYGDIVPWGGHAKSVAITEAVIGIMYPAVLIGRLIGLHGIKRSRS
jgi:voltage-gated potassium channel